MVYKHIKIFDIQKRGKQYSYTYVILRDIRPYSANTDSVRHINTLYLVLQSIDDIYNTSLDIIVFSYYLILDM